MSTVTMYNYFLDGTYCLDGWLGFNGQCYLVVDGFTTTEYDDAEYECAHNHDATLVSLIGSHHRHVQHWTNTFLQTLADCMYYYVVPVLPCLT